MTLNIILLQLDFSLLGTTMSKRICIVGSLGQDSSVFHAAQSFNVPIIFSETGEECVSDGESFTTYFIVDEFSGPCFDYLCKMKCR